MYNPYVYVMYYTCRVFEWYDKVGGSTGMYVRGSILLGQCLLITTTTRMKDKHLKGRRKSGFLKIFFLRDCVCVCCCCMLLTDYCIVIYYLTMLSENWQKISWNICMYVYYSNMSKLKTKPCSTIRSKLNFKKKIASFYKLNENLKFISSNMSEKNIECIKFLD